MNEQGNTATPFKVSSVANNHKIKTIIIYNKDQTGGWDFKNLITLEI